MDFWIIEIQIFSFVWFYLNKIFMTRKLHKIPQLMLLSPVRDIADLDYFGNMQK